MEIIADKAYERIDNFLKTQTSFTRSYIKQLIDNGNILLNNKSIKAGKRVSKGDIIKINEPIITLDILPQDIPLDIIYEDTDIAVINKQAGLSVHPSARIKENTLVNAIMNKIKNLSTINGVIRPGIVHRLDKDTTGAIIIAKNDKSHLSLSEQFANKTVKKIYHAIVEGVIKQQNGQIITNISRNTIKRKEMTVSSTGRQAITHYNVIERFSDNTYVEFDIKTGRTHQIRVHAKHINHPVVGDKTYGYKKQKFNLNGQLLHAHSITIIHPKTNKEMTFIAPLPEIFTKTLNTLKNIKEKI